MHRKFWKSAMATAVVAGMAIVGSASPARAVPVTYTTVGTFLGGTTPNTSVFTAAGTGGGTVRIAFEGVTSNTVDAPSFASFGQFNTTGTTATTPTAVSGGFRLDIFQVTPGPAATPAQFIGSLSGSLDSDSSTAFVQFTTLTQNITVGGFTTIYTILEADSDQTGTSVRGRSNLNPPTTNQGRSTVEGFIATTGTPPPAVVPEPSTLLMGAFAAPAVLIFLRRKGKVTV